MHRFATLALSITSAIVVASCTSLRLIEPHINVSTVEVPRALPETTRQFFTTVQVEILNRSGEPVSLQRIEFASVGVGPFTILQTSRDFNQAIEPSQGLRFPVWAQMTYNGLDETLAQSEGPLIVRGVAVFTTPGGGFRQVFLQRVNTSVSQKTGRD